MASGVNAPYGNWNTDYTNTYDVVPHAWHQLGHIVEGPDSGGNYGSIYGVLDPDLGYSLAAAIQAAQALALGGDYRRQTQHWFTPDWGFWSWTQNADGSWQYPPVWTTLTTYTEQNPLSSIDTFGELVLAAHIDQVLQLFRSDAGAAYADEPARRRSPGGQAPGVACDGEDLPLSVAGADPCRR